MLGVAEALLSEDDDLERELGAVLDIDTFIQFWALETLTAHADGYTQASNNSFVYFDPNRENRAVFIPWGPDDALQRRLGTPVKPSKPRTYSPRTSRSRCPERRSYYSATPK